MFVDTSAFTNLFTLAADFYISANLDFSLFACLLFFEAADLVFSLCVSFLILVIQDMTKLFYIGKPITNANIITALIYTKVTLWIDKVLFLFLDDAW